MDRWIAILFIMVAVGVSSCQGRDVYYGDIATPGSHGSDVVESVTQKLQASCIFPDDKLFLRRLAYVESIDGLHEDTYRDGYHGGIWQMDEDMYENIKTSIFESTMRTYLTAIHDKFDLDWMNTTWEDLRIPFVSGLGARLYLQYQDPYKDAIPRSIEDQGDYYVSHYRTNDTAQTFIEAASKLEEGCEYNRADIVFVLDSSGSIGRQNFDDMINFVAEVIKSFNIGSNETQIALLQFETKTHIEWHLDSYHDKDEMLQKLGTVDYKSGGTNTHLALDVLVKEMFQEDNGARGSSYPQVAIVVTDGRSNDKVQTIRYAGYCHDANLNMLAVGVDNYDYDELEAIASEPKCLNIFELAGFDEIEALKAAIEQAACDAPIIMQPSEEGVEVDTVLPPGASQDCQLKVNEDGATVKLTAETGAASFYIAYDSYPSSAYYEDMVEATPEIKGVLYVHHPSSDNPTTEEGLVFCNIKGSDVDDSEIVFGLEYGDTDWCREVDCGSGKECVDTGDSYECVSGATRLYVPWLMIQLCLLTSVMSYRRK